MRLSGTEEPLGEDIEVFLVTTRAMGATLQALSYISYAGALAVEALSLPIMRTAGQKTAGLLRSYRI